jgi:phosphate transport system substrate-binding protein
MCRKLYPLLLVIALAPITWPQEDVRLIGVGSTLPLPVYSRLFRAFEETHPQIHTSYMPFGSSRGQEMVAAGTADFGASDSPSSEHPLPRKILFFPTFVGAVVPVYNLPGINASLKFTPKALAGIYLGKITRWNDAELTGPNPGVALPASEIVVVHSAAGRGTTYIWTDYLSKVSSEWKTKVGRGISVHWPVGVEAEGTGNAARAVKETLNSIAYVGTEQAAQLNLTCGTVQNSAGRFVSANSLTMTAAALGALKGMPSDFRGSITNSPGENSYPISSFTWLVVAEEITPSEKREAAQALLRWMLTDGQTTPSTPGFVRLPKELVEQELRAVNKVR